MRFLYGFILGVLATTIGAILYLAFAGGEYVVQLSPHYHELTSEVASLREAKAQRDQLAGRLDALTRSFDELTRRFSDLAHAPRESSHPAEAPAAAPEPAPAPTHEAAPSPTPPA